MSLPPLTFRSDVGRPLDSTEGDNNIHNLDDRITDIETGPNTAISIDYVTQAGGNTFSITLTNHDIEGPFTIPTSNWDFRGAWQPSFAYSAFDVVTNNSAVYLVNLLHTSSTTFDPGATDGMAHNLYSLLVQSVRGPRGARGALGQGGAQGDGGQTGAPGKRGKVGAKGDKGDTGTAGTPGGPRGFRGMPGVGIQGEPSMVPGPRGKRGKTGLTGSTGPAGMAGVQIEVQEITTSGATLTIDRNAGEYVIVELASNITSVVISNYAPSSPAELTKITLDFRNTGPFGITGWVSGMKWFGGTPTIDSGSGKDLMVVIMSPDGGGTIRGATIGKNSA